MVEQVTILEASDRVGGRVHTYRHPSGKWYAELGAMRIPTQHKLVNTFIKKFKLQLRPFHMSDNDTFYYVNNIRKRTWEGDANPDALKYPTVAWERGKTAADIFNRATDLLREQMRTMGPDYVQQKYDQYSVMSYLESVAMLSRGALRMIGTMLNEGGIFHTSLLESIRDQIELGPATKFNEIINGTESLTDAFKPFLKSNIRLKAKVTNIYRDSKEVRIQYEDGSSGNKPSTVQTLKGDFAIVTTTAPATRFIEFDPPLALEKKDALAAIHYDAAAKIFLRCKDRFWEKDNITGGKSITDEVNRFIYYPSHHDGTSGGTFLASYTWGDDALIWSSFTEQGKINAAGKIVSKIHQRDVTSLCKEGVSKDWTDDPYAKGAYALFTPLQQRHLYYSLASPDYRVHFAGEHTVLQHAWMEGSIASGIRAALQVHTGVYDLVVVGGGPIGLATAYYAAKKGARVAILDKYTIGNDYGSSAGSSRQFREMYENKLLAKMARESIGLWHELEKETNMTMLYQDGYLFLGDQNTGNTTEGNFVKIMQTCKELSMDCKILSKEQIEARFPFKNLPTHWIGLYHLESGQVNAKSAIKGLHKKVKDLGVTIYENLSVENISMIYDDYMQIRTPRDFMQAKKVVVAPGPFANDIFRLLGFEINLNIWEMPSFYYKMKNTKSHFPTWFAFGGDEKQLYYGFPENNWDVPGYARICPDFVKKAISHPSQRSNKPDMDSFFKTTRFVADRVAGVEWADTRVSSQTCLATNVPDGGFVLDQAPPVVKNNQDIFIFAAGWGFKFVPLFGKILAELAIDGKTNHDIKPFSVQRPGILKETKLKQRSPNYFGSFMEDLQPARKMSLKSQQSELRAIKVQASDIQRVQRNLEFPFRRSGFIWWMTGAVALAICLIVAITAVVIYRRGQRPYRYQECFNNDKTKLFQSQHSPDTTYTQL